tara:strand:+ start:14 stop:244 length:231 start_codon:yes stop_codon:yes gene_type:complete
MVLILKKLLFVITLNSALLLMVIIGIQNSSNRKKVDFLIGETVNLPISFIVGISFISGSLLGSLITNNIRTKKDSF